MDLVQRLRRLPTIKDPNFPYTSDPYWDSVILLLRGDGTNGSTTITDESGNHSLTAYGDAVIDTANKAFGSGAYRFDGHRDYLQINGGSFPALGVDDFTIETWFRALPFGTVHQVIIDSRPPGIHLENDFALSINISGFLVFALQGNIVVIANNYNCMDGEWHHAAVTRESNLFRLFFDGNLVSSATNTVSIRKPITDRPCIGVSAYGIGSNPPEDQWDYGWFTLNGHIDEFRITQGVARYTKNFRPPISQFPSV